MKNFGLGKECREQILLRWQRMREERAVPPYKDHFPVSYVISENFFRSMGYFDAQNPSLIQAKGGSQT